MIYIISGQRCWPVEEASFVDAAQCTGLLPEEVTELFVDGQIADEDYLRTTLRFYGHRLGELMTAEEKAAAVRTERDRRIAATDYLMAADYPLSDDSRTAWIAYRQALRDLPQMEGFPWGGEEGVPWPVAPAVPVSANS